MEIEDDIFGAWGTICKRGPGNVKRKWEDVLWKTDGNPGQVDRRLEIRRFGEYQGAEKSTKGGQTIVLIDGIARGRQGTSMINEQEEELRVKNYIQYTGETNLPLLSPEVDSATYGFDTILYFLEIFGTLELYW